MTSTPTEKTLDDIRRWTALESQARKRLKEIEDSVGPEMNYARQGLRDAAAFHRANAEGAKREVEVAARIDRAGPYCSTDAHVGGITINFQNLRVHIHGYSIEARSSHRG